VVTGKGLLSVGQSQELIKHAEEHGFKSAEWEYAKEYRECSRVVVKEAKLAQLLWEKLAEVLTAQELFNVSWFDLWNGKN